MLEDMKRWGIPDDVVVKEPRTPAQEVELLPFCLYLTRQPKIGLKTARIIKLPPPLGNKNRFEIENYAQQQSAIILRDLANGRNQGIDAKLKFKMSYGDIFLNEEATELVEVKYLTQLLRAGYRIEAW